MVVQQYTYTYPLHVIGLWLGFLCCQSVALSVNTRHSNCIAAAAAAQRSRRSVLVELSWQRPAISILGALITTTTIYHGPTTTPAFAVTEDDDPMIIVNTLLMRMRKVPTFCIVDAEQHAGATYMVLKKDPVIAIGYAFATFPGALAVLADAQRNAKEKGYFDVWKDATITTIPLDIAVRLALKQKTRVSTKGQELSTLLMVVPGADERLDAAAMNGRFKDQGRVPLFYVDNIDMDSSEAIQLYFSRKDLIAEWRKVHPNDGIPKVQALDLMTDLLESILRGGQRRNPIIVNGADRIQFVPSQESLDMAKELKERGLVSYNPNTMIL